MASLPPPGSRSQLPGLPGVPAGQHGAQPAPHAAARGAIPDRQVPVCAGRLRQRHLPDEQLVHGYSQAAGEEAGGERCTPLQVRDTVTLFCSFVCNHKHSKYPEIHPHALKAMLCL